MLVAKFLPLFLMLVANGLNLGYAEEDPQTKEISESKSSADRPGLLQYPSDSNSFVINDNGKRVPRGLDLWGRPITHPVWAPYTRPRTTTPPTQAPNIEMFNLLRKIFKLVRHKLGRVHIPGSSFNEIAEYAWSGLELPYKRPEFTGGRGPGVFIPTTKTTTTTTTTPPLTAPPENKVFHLPESASATQISEAFRMYTADKAINGDKEPRYYDDKHACAITGRERNPWWEVDFGGTTTVREVWLYNCGGRSSIWRQLGNLTIEVDNRLCNEFAGPAPPGSITGPSAIVYCKRPLTGRKMKIRKNGHKLCICEVEWF